MSDYQEPKDYIKNKLDYKVINQGVVEKGGLVLQCLGWQERKSKESKNETNRC